MSHPIPGKGILFACCLSILPFCTDAQVTLHDSKELIDLGIARYDEGKYKEALEAFRKVPEGDTNFHIAKYEMALSAFADSAFAEARNHALEGLTLPFADRRSMRLLLGHSYDGLDKKDSAFYYYDQLLKENPHDHIAYYEKGVVYFNRKEYDKALEAFRTGLLINPYHFNLHRMTGVTYMRQGRLTEATLSLATSLLFTNNMQTARSSIILLNNMASQTAEIAKFYEEKDSRYEHELFNEIDAIINARLALSKGYKVPSVMSDDNIIRLLYVVMEKAKYSADDTSFAMQYYVPLFTNIFKEDQFDPFVLLLFSNFGLETVDQYAKKQKRDISRVRDIVFPYADKIVNTRTLNFKAREKAPLKYFYNSSSNVYIDAAFRMGKEDIEFTGGPAVYYKNNVLTAAGNFNKDGKKEGEWNYYFSFGKLRLTEQYKNGTIQGKAYSYRLNGHLKEITTYDAEGNEITEETFTYNGQPHIRTKFLTGKESELVYLHKNGHEQQKLRIKNDKVSDGKYQTYYVNGKLSREMDIKDGKLHGVMREYYENGQLREEIEYRNGDRHGKYTSWYDDGQKEDEYQYANGKPDGPYI
ncbi:MAG: tetratricopeptide repeat protein, partial [Sphingobacteriales bacterium]